MKIWVLLDSAGGQVYRNRIYTKCLAFAKQLGLKNYKIVSVENDPLPPEDGWQEPGGTL